MSASTASLSILSDRSSRIRLIQTNTGSSKYSSGYSSTNLQDQHQQQQQRFFHADYDRTATSSNNIDVSLTFPTSTINYEPIYPDNSYNLTSRPSGGNPIVGSQYNQHSYLQSQQNVRQQPQQSNGTGNGETVGFSSSVAPHVAGVPGLVRRSSSRRMVVVKRAPSIRSERKRISTVSEEHHLTDDHKRFSMADSSSYTKYDFHAPKRNHFRFIKRKKSVKSKYKHQRSLQIAFEGTEAYQLAELYNRNKRDPLVLQTFDLTNKQKLKADPKLTHKLKSVSIDLQNGLHFADPTAEIIELYFSNYTAPSSIAKHILPPPLPSTRSSTPSIKRPRSFSRQSQSSSSKKSSASAKEYKALENYVFGLKTKDSSRIFQISNVREDHIKTLAMKIYLRRLITAKIALRTYLESSSSGSYATVPDANMFGSIAEEAKQKVGINDKKNAKRVNQENPDDFNFISQQNINYQRPHPPSRFNFSNDSLHSNSIIDVSFPSSTGSAMTFHSFR